MQVLYCLLLSIPPFLRQDRLWDFLLSRTNDLTLEGRNLFFLSVVGDRRVSVWSIRSSKVVPWDVGFIGFGFDWAVNSFGMRLSSLFDHTVVAVLTVVVYRVV